MAETPISATQRRVTTLLGITSDGTYAHASHVLAAAGLPSDGVPAGHTWRTVKKLGDDELRALLVPDAELYAAYAQPYESALDRSLRLAEIDRQARKASDWRLRDTRGSGAQYEYEPATGTYIERE